MQKKIAIPQYISQTARDYLKEKGYQLLDGYETTDIEQLKKIVADADAILARTAPYCKEVIDASPRLKIISRQGVGYDNIDVEYCTSKGIWVTYAPQANFNTVAEHALGLMIASAHHIVRMDKAVHKGNWNARNKEKGHDLKGKTLGVIGFGRIGSCLCKKAVMGLEMKAIAYDAFIPEDSFPEFVQNIKNRDDLLSQSDFVSLHLPSNQDTFHCVNLEFLKKMKPTAVLINCARGDIVCESDLFEALQNGTIGGAAVDVMEHEPPSLDNPLLSLENFIVTPHNAALTVETMDRMGLHAAMGIDDVLNERIPQWPINKIIDC